MYIQNEYFLLLISNKMSNSNDESPNFSITHTQNNTTSDNTIQVPNLINPITISSEPGFIINSTDAHILNNLLGVGNTFLDHVNSNLTSTPSTPSTPLAYTTTPNPGQSVSSVITISRNIFNDLPELDEDNGDMSELTTEEELQEQVNTNHPLFNTSNSTESENPPSGEANPPSSEANPPPILDRMESLEHLIRRLSNRRRMRNTSIPGRRNADFLRFFGHLMEDVEDQIVRQVMRESFAEDQEKRLIDIARKLSIEKEKFDPNKELHKEFCSCRVCLEDYKEGEELGVLPCNHFFHYNCVQEWGKRKPNCPYCNVEIPTVQLDPESNKKQKLN